MGDAVVTHGHFSRRGITLLSCCSDCREETILFETRVALRTVKYLRFECLGCPFDRGCDVLNGQIESRLEIIDDEVTHNVSVSDHDHDLRHLVGAFDANFVPL